MRRFYQILLSALFALELSAVAHAQTPTPTPTPNPLFPLVKTCSPSTVTLGEETTCSFTLTNNTGGDITAVSVINFIPSYPGGAQSGRLPCVFNGVPLALTDVLPDGEQCTGSFKESTTDCSAPLTDTLHATAARGPGLGSIQSFSYQTVSVPTCTPTNSPTVTPTNTPTGTATPLPSGVQIVKTCPSTAGSGELVTCTFVMTNLSSSETIQGTGTGNVLQLYGFEPDSISGPPPTSYGPIPCKRFDTPVSTLGPAGSGTESCSGSYAEFVPNCSTTGDSVYRDYLWGGGTVQGCSVDCGRFAYSNTASVVVLACTPTITPGGPTLTPTPTPTATGTPPTNTPTSTPTVTGSRTNTPTPPSPPTNTPTRTITPTGTVTVTPTGTPQATTTPVGARCPTYLYGRILKPDGTGVTGRVYFTLAKQGNLLTTGGCCGPGAVGPPATTSFALSNGELVGGIILVGGMTLRTPLLMPTDCISPAGNYYKMTVIDSKGAVVLRRNVTVPSWTADIGALPIHP